MIPYPSKPFQHGPSIDKCELHALTGHKVPQYKGNNVTAVLKPSKPYFAWHIQQSATTNTTLSVTRSLYCMCQFSHSNLVTTPPSCIFLTLQSVLSQNLICQPPSSSCRISFSLDTLKTEMKPPFTAIITKTPCYMLARLGIIPVKRTCIMAVRMGSIPVGRISMEMSQRATSSHNTHSNVLDTHAHLMASNTWTPLMYPGNM